MSADEANKGSGMKTCLIVACSFLLLVCIVSGVALYIGAKGAFNKTVGAYTEEQPRALPRVDLPQDAIDAALERADRFAEAVSNGEPTAPLVLSSEDINTLIQHHPNWKDLSDKVYVSIEDDRIRGEISIPLEELSPMLSGRYLNGSAAFTVSLADGRLLVFLESAEVKGKPIPEPFMQEMRKENLAKDAGQDPEFASVIQQLDSVDVAGGKLAIRSKGSQ